MPVTYLVKFQVVPERRAEFLERLEGVLDAMRDEPMFHEAILHRDPQSEHRFMLYETWEDHEDVLSVQLNRPYRRAWHDALPALLEQERDISIWQPHASRSQAGLTVRGDRARPHSPRMRKWTMTIRPIVRYPDPRLALPAQPATVFDDALRELAMDLLETLRAAPGIGITAPHVGLSVRVVVLDLNPTDGPRTYVNPRIDWASPEMIMHQEGSISMPGVSDDIRRHQRVRISYQDLDGHVQTEESDGLRAVCHQHEIDQLDGLFWIQRLSHLKRQRLIKRFEKLSRGPRRA